MEVTVDLSPSLRITLCGDATSIGEVIQKLGNGKVSQIPEKNHLHKKTRTIKTRIRGLKKCIVSLKREGFFSEPRSTEDVTREIISRGISTGEISVSPALNRLAKQRKLKREVVGILGGGRQHLFHWPHILDSTKGVAKRKKRGEISDLMNTLIEEGFFQTPQESFGVQEELQRKGENVSLNSIYSGLRILINRGVLQKEEEGGLGRGQRATYINKPKGIFSS